MSTATKTPSCKEVLHELKDYPSGILPFGYYQDRLEAQEIINSLKTNF